MGVFSWIGDLAGGIGDIALDIANPLSQALGIGDIRNAITGYKNQLTGENAMQMNRENIALQKETNAMNFAMHQNDIQAQKELQQISQEYNSKEAEKARQFNSAEQQMKRLQDAGINPFVAAQSVSGVQANSSGVSASIAPSSVPSGYGMVAPHNDVMAGQQGFSNSIAMFQTLAQLLSSTGSFKRDTASAKEIQALIEGKVKQLFLTNEALDLDNAARRINNDIFQLTGLKKANAEVQQLVSSEARNLAEARTLAIQGKKAESEIAINKVLEQHERLKKRLTRKQIKMYEPYYNALIEESRQKARLAQAQTSTEDATRGAKVANLRADTRVKNSQADINLFTKGIQALNFHDLSETQDWLDKTTTMEDEYGNVNTLKNRDWLNSNNLHQVIADIRKTNKLSEKEIKEIEHIEQMVKLAEKENNVYYWNAAINALGKLGTGAIGAMLFK